MEIKQEKKLWKKISFSIYAINYFKMFLVPDSCCSNLFFFFRNMSLLERIDRSHREFIRLLRSRFLWMDDWENVALVEERKGKKMLWESDEARKLNAKISKVAADLEVSFSKLIHTKMTNSWRQIRSNRCINSVSKERFLPSSAFCNHSMKGRIFSKKCIFPFGEWASRYHFNTESSEITSTVKKKCRELVNIFRVQRTTFFSVAKLCSNLKVQLINPRLSGLYQFQKIEVIFALASLNILRLHKWQEN